MHALLIDVESIRGCRKSREERASIRVLARPLHDVRLSRGGGGLLANIACDYPWLWFGHRLGQFIESWWS